MAKRKKRRDLGLSALAVLLFIVLFIFFSGFFVGYSCADKPKSEEKPKVTQTKEPVGATDKTEANPLVEEKMADMTLSDMVYQMMIVSPEEITNVEVATLAGESTKKAIESQPIGGLLYGEKNFEDDAQVESLIKNSQSFSKIPLFIAIADDGADKYSKEEFEQFGFNLILTDKIVDKAETIQIDDLVIYKYVEDKSVVDAIKAGADMIYNSTEAEDTHAEIVKAVEDGDVSEDEIKESVAKILTFKIEKGILN